MLFEKIALTSGQIATTAGKNRKVELIAALLKQVAADERAITARILSGETGHKLGIGSAIVSGLRGQISPAASASITILEVDQRLGEIASLDGAGSNRARREKLGELLARGTRVEQEFLGALVLGGLRQGVLAALVVEGIARAVDLEPGGVRTAYMLAGEVGAVAAAVLAEGPAALTRFGLTVFRPVLPMLAKTAHEPGEAIASFDGPAWLEYKLDGFRVQIHKADEAVRIYSRALNEVTASVPELVAAVAALPARRLILDGEAIAWGPSGRPMPFQDTIKLLGKHPGASQLSLSLFDLLLLDDQTLLATAAGERFAALDALAPAHRLPRLVTGDAAKAVAFYQQAISCGHEGVMAKALDAPYQAGNRGASWLKIKKVHRLDLIVLAVEWGSGRRQGVLSNLHLGARNPAGGWVMVSKTFKGMTDAVLAWQTAQLLAREVGREDQIVHVRPELVVEIAFNDVQRSSQYPGGLALRHARLVRYRDDKSASEADTLDAIRAIAIADGVIGL